jgi:hypothetical protein
VEEVHGQHGRGLGPEELPPRRIGLPGWCWGYSLAADDRYRANRKTIADQCTPELRRSVQSLQLLLDQLTGTA